MRFGVSLVLNPRQRLQNIEEVGVIGVTSPDTLQLLLAVGFREGAKFSPQRSGVLFRGLDLAEHIDQSSHGVDLLLDCSGILLVPSKWRAAVAIQAVSIRDRHFSAWLSCRAVGALAADKPRFLTRFENTDLAMMSYDGIQTYTRSA